MWPVRNGFEVSRGRKSETKPTKITDPETGRLSGLDLIQDEANADRTIFRNEANDLVGLRDRGPSVSRKVGLARGSTPPYRLIPKRSQSRDWIDLAGDPIEYPKRSQHESIPFAIHLAMRLIPRRSQRMAYPGSSMSEHPPEIQS